MKINSKAIARLSSSDTIWALRPDAYKHLSAQLERGDWYDEDDDYAIPKRQSSVVMGDVAFIFITGVIVSGFDENTCYWCGLHDMSSIREDIEIAMGDPNVNSISLIIDSPGGMVQGLPELVSYIREMGVVKPVSSYSSGTMASAAYWIACAGDNIFAAPTADVGSIGILLPLFDTSAYLAAIGIKIDLIKSGKYKGAGHEGTSLTDEQRENFQERVNYLFGMFVNDVRYNREVDDETMQGQVFLGSQSTELIDGIYSTTADYSVAAITGEHDMTDEEKAAQEEEEKKAKAKLEEETPEEEIEETPEEETDEEKKKREEKAEEDKKKEGAIAPIPGKKSPEAIAIAKLKTEVAELRADNEKLRADLAKVTGKVTTAESRAQKLIAQSGHKPIGITSKDADPAEVTPKDFASFMTAYGQIKDPTKAAAYYAKHSKMFDK